MSNQQPTPPATAAPAQGGQGGEPIPGVDFDAPQISRAEMVLVRKAIKDGWPVTSEIRAACVAECSRLVTTGIHRNRLAAMRTLVEMDKANVAIEASGTPAVIQHEHHHEHSGAITVEQRRTSLLGIFAALRERAGVAADPKPANGHAANGHNGYHPPDAPAVGSS